LPSSEAWKEKKGSSIERREPRVTEPSSWTATIEPSRTP
jgi:hypothetical protein